MADAKLTVPEAAQWRTIGVYTSGQAACLLLDLPPGDADEWVLPPAAAALEARIRAHYDLAPNSPNRPSPRPRTIDHAQLTGFAIQVGMTKAQILGAKPDKLDPRKERTLLLTIRALAQMANLPNEPFKAADAIIAQLAGMGIQRDRKAIADALKDAQDAS